MGRALLRANGDEGAADAAVVARIAEIRLEIRDDFFDSWIPVFERYCGDAKAFGEVERVWKEAHGVHNADDNLAIRRAYDLAEARRDEYACSSNRQEQEEEGT